MSDRRTVSPVASAVGGGIIGALLSAAILLFAIPSSLSTKIVRQGMLSDPSILTQAAEALRDGQYAPVLKANRAAIEVPFASSWRGASKPDVTLVEYFDYACPYCKASNADINRLLNEDKGLRVVFRELPVLGPDSVTAARISLAASKLGRFNQYHDQQWAAGRPGAETIAAAAAAAGVPPTPANDPAIEAEIKRNFQIAGQLGATGTPLFVIGDQVFNSAIGYDGMKAAIAKARNSTSS